MQERDEYVKKLKTQIDNWNADLELLEAKVVVAKADGKAAIHARIAELRGWRDQVLQKADEIATASNDGWQHLRTGVDETWKALTDALSSAKSSLS